MSAQPPEFNANIIERFDAVDAFQAVAVDADSFYAITNKRLTQHDKNTGRATQQSDENSQLSDALIHLDSGMVFEGKLYSAHSNYPGWPMTSSIEVWDVATMEHIESHSFGVMLGSFTWLDRYNGSWWGAFANYDIVQRGMTEPYGETYNTVIVQFDDDFEVVQSWSLPAEILRRMSPMSNSGGSWGSDGHLYLSGHDDPEIYVMALPETGPELDWLATVRLLGLNGQGIAWDRTIDDNILWAILRSTRQVLKIGMPVLPDIK
ncbi:MAG: hypothetical protein JKY86_09615 [Gammaproteobacteria bacterium]|nr:hypothetical protein [Gammaproteobacteria bacterium]